MANLSNKERNFESFQVVFDNNNKKIKKGFRTRKTTDTHGSVSEF